MAIVFLPLYIKHIGIEAFGLVGLYAVVQNFIFLLDLGMSPTLNREIARFTLEGKRTDEVRSLLSSFELICYLLAGIMIILGILFSKIIAEAWIKEGAISVDIVSQSLILIVIASSLRLCEGIYRESLYGLQRQAQYNLIFAAFSTLRYGGALLVLIYLSNTVIAFFIWQVLISFFSLLTLAILLHRSLPGNYREFQFSFDSIRSVWKFSSGMLGFAVLTAFFLQFDKVMLSHWDSLGSLGYYLLAGTAANILFLISAPISQAIYPRLVRLASSPTQLDETTLFRKASQLVAVLTCSVAIIFSFYSSGVIFIWSGNSQLLINVAPLLSILVIGSLFNSLSYLPYQLQIANGHIKSVFKIYLSIVLLFVVLILVFTPIYGVEGAAWIWFFVNGVYFTLVTYFTHKDFLSSIRLNCCVTDVLLPGCGALLVAYVAHYFQPQEYVDRLGWILFLLFTGAFALFVSTVCSSLLRSELFKLLRLKNNE